MDRLDGDGDERVGREEGGGGGGGRKVNDEWDI